MAPTTLTSNSKGFTLVEVLVAMAILLVGLLGLLQSINLAMEHNLKNHLREEATRVGEREMNALRMGIVGQTRISSSIPRLSFVLTRNSSVIRVDAMTSKELEVIVAWKYRNMSTQHRVKSIRTL